MNNELQTNGVPAEPRSVGRLHAPKSLNSRRRSVASAVVLVLVVVPKAAAALEISSGVSLGGIQIGTVPRLAVSPNASLSWHMESGFMFAVHDVFNIVPPIKTSGLGVYNHTAVAIGYAWENGNLSAGLALSIYSVLACGATLCGRVVGVAPGGHAQASLYFAEPLGVSVSADVDWVGGRSLVLPGGVAAMVVAGPVIRWSSK